MEDEKLIEEIKELNAKIEELSTANNGLEDLKENNELLLMENEELKKENLDLNNQISGLAEQLKTVPAEKEIKQKVCFGTYENTYKKQGVICRQCKVAQECKKVK